LTTNHDYFIQVVPTSLTKLDGVTFDSYQYTVNYNSWGSHPHPTPGGFVPTLYFRYDITPIRVHYWHEREGITHFFVQLCAIVGGVFTVAGLLVRLSARLATLH